MTITPQQQRDLTTKLDALSDAVESVQEAYRIQFGVELAREGMPGEADPEGVGLGSTVALTSDAASFSLAVVCDETTARHLAASFFGSDPESEVKLADLADALNELPNVAAGAWKARRARHGESYQLGLPIFLKGSSWLRYFSKGVNAIAQKLIGPAGTCLQVVLIWQSGQHCGGIPPMTSQTAQPDPQTSSLPIQVLQEATEAVVTTCDVQLSLRLEVDSNPSDPRQARVDYGSSIALTTEEGSGWNLAVMADKASCQKLTRVLFAMEDDEEPEMEDLADGLGEIGNVAAGVLKSKRMEAGQRCQLGLPLFMEGSGCIEFFASGLQGLSQSLIGPDGLVVHVILIWQEG